MSEVGIRKLSAEQDFLTVASSFRHFDVVGETYKIQLSHTVSVKHFLCS